MAIHRHPSQFGDAWGRTSGNGLYKAEVIHRSSWRNRAQVELATLDWGALVQHKRLLGPIGHVPPAEAEADYYQQHTSQAKAV